MAPPLSPEAVQTDSTRVTHIRVVVHNLGAAGPDPSDKDNHWSLYLLHSDEISSTRMNMRAEKGDPTGVLEWTRHGYNESSAVTYWDFPAAKRTKVLSIACYLYHLRRDRYIMPGGGSDCRWWVYTIVYDLTRGSHIQKNAPNQIWPHLLYRYHAQKERELLQIVPQGEFY